MFMTLKPAADVRKDTDNSRYLFERVEKAGIPSLISRASNNGEYKVEFDYATLNWDRNFLSRVVGLLRDFGYTVNDPKTVTVVTVSWEANDRNVKEEVEDDEYL